MSRALQIVIAGWVVAVGLPAAEGAGPQPTEAHFKYGSVGIESEEGLPYWIRQVLPRVFADKLPGGYASLGFVWEPGRELPVGFSKRDGLGSTRVAVNCAFCHTATYRLTDAAPPPDDSIGTSDMLPLWSLPLRDGRAFHWDGLNPSLGEVLRSSAIGNGASVTSVDLPAVDAVATWVSPSSAPTGTGSTDGARPLHRGYDVLDAQRVGFIASGPEAERHGTLFETKLPGNGNAGHLYGTDLPDDKTALVEFLKTQ